MAFKELGLNARMVSRLDTLGLIQPTPILQQSIPQALKGRDILGIAQTGTGKTSAFGVPLVVALSTRHERRAPRSARDLILAATRELAGQIVQSPLRLTADLRMTFVVGGKLINAQAKRLAPGTDILVATPGRLIDLMDRQAIYLGETRFLVLDEADQMLDIRFVHALRRNALMLGKDRQTAMSSVTMPKAMADLSRQYLNKPIRVRVSAPGKVADKIAHSVQFFAREQKPALLIDLLNGHRDDRAVVFSRTKRETERPIKQLFRAGFAATPINGNKSQVQRDLAIAAFKDGWARVLVATDVAARGIDIPDVGHVYSYDLPNVTENYVHRIGRTARARRDGRAVAFCAPDEVSDGKAIEKVLGMRVEIAGGRAWEVIGNGPEARKGRRPRRRSSARSERIAA